LFSLRIAIALAPARGGDTSSSASPEDSGEVGGLGVVAPRNARAAFSTAGSNGGEVGEGLLDEVENRLRRGGVSGSASIMATMRGTGVEFLRESDACSSSPPHPDRRPPPGPRGSSSSTRRGESASPLTRHIRCGLHSPLESLLLSGDDVMERDVASEPDSHSSVLLKRDDDAKDEVDWEVDTVETESLAL
jgi:hypothetical protein